MRLIIGIVVAVGCMLTGFLLHHGKLILLYVPSEWLIIGGMGVGSMVIGNPPRVLRGVLAGIMKLFRGGGRTKRQRSLPVSSS